MLRVDEEQNISAASTNRRNYTTATMHTLRLRACVCVPCASHNSSQRRRTHARSAIHIASLVSPSACTIHTTSHRQISCVCVRPKHMMALMDVAYGCHACSRTRATSTLAWRANDKTTAKHSNRMCSIALLFNSTD